MAGLSQLSAVEPDEESVSDEGSVGGFHLVGPGTAFGTGRSSVVRSTGSSCWLKCGSCSRWGQVVLTSAGSGKFKIHSLKNDIQFMVGKDWRSFL